MTNVLFARPRHDYQSYTDLYRLIELAGYPLIYIDEIDDQSDNMYILTIINDEVTGWPNARAKIVAYDLEWHDSPPLILGVSDVWAADAFYAQRIGARYIPLGSDSRLNPIPDAERTEEYDVALLAYMGPTRRQEVQEGLRSRGITIMPNAWGDERHNGLLSSRAMCHIHQLDNFPCVAAQRLAIAAAYRMPYFTETVIDAGIFGSNHWFMSDHANLAELVSIWLRGKDRGRLQDAGDALHYLLCEKYTFERCISAAL